MNKIRKYINDYRMNIITDLKKYETVEVRKIGRQLEQSLTLDELKNECRKLDQEKFSELQTKYEDLDEDAQKSMFALEIANKDLTFAKSLLNN